MQMNRSGSKLVSTEEQNNLFRMNGFFAISHGGADISFESQLIQKGYIIWHQATILYRKPCVNCDCLQSFDDFDSLPSGYPDSLRDMDHFTTLMLTDVDHGDAGTYSCRRSAAEIVPIDIFVYDAEHPAAAPFDPDPDLVVQVFAFIGEEAFIPCIPSHPGKSTPKSESIIV